MKRSCRQLLFVGMCAQYCKEFAGELLAVFSQYIRRYSIRNDPIIKKYVHHIGGWYVNCCNCSVEIGIPIGYYDDTLVFFAGLRKRARNVRSDKFQ